MQQVADKMNFQDPVQKYAECHSWDMSNSNATKYHEIKVGILDNTCLKENVPTFEILVGWILRLGLNFWVINVALYGWKCDPAYHWLQIGQAIILHILKMVYMPEEFIFSFNLWNIWCQTCESLNVNVTTLVTPGQVPAPRLGLQSLHAMDMDMDMDMKHGHGTRNRAVGWYLKEKITYRLQIDTTLSAVGNKLLE